MIRLSRRRFLQVLAGATGALVVGIPLVDAADAPVPAGWLGDQLYGLGTYVRVDADGSVLIGARDPETGTGAATALARIIADEMDADWTSVKVIALGPDTTQVDGATRFVYGHQLGGTGTSVPTAWNDLRPAGALARWLLLQAAARQLGVPADQLRCEAGHVIAGDGRRLGYGALAEAAAKIDPPKVPVPIKTPDRFTLIGKGAGDADARAVVTGQARFGIDHANDDALVAVLAHCPWPDGSLDRIDTTKALAVKGVQKVLRLAPEKGQAPGTTPRCAAIAVVAESTWAALRGRAALELKWKPGAAAGESTAAIEQQAQTLLAGDDAPTLRMRNDGDVDAASKKAARRIEATYVQPWLAHATAEPMNCFARIEKDRAELVIPTQAPQQALAVVQRLTGLSPAQITIRIPRVGGGYGRRLDHDYVAEAVMLGKMLDKPVRLLWTREDDLAHDFYRSGSVHAMQAIIGRKRQLLAWSQRFATAPALAGRGVPEGRLGTAEADPGHLPAGLVPNFRLDWYALQAVTPRGPMRGMPDTAQAFAVESFIDEIAHVMRENPLDTRLRVIGEPRQLPLPGGGALDTGRLANVLKLAAERIDWPTWLHTVNGLGIAAWYMDGAYVAHAVEASMQGEQLTIERAVCVADIGRAINPTGLEGQLAGATLDALGQALNQAITVRDGQVQQRDWSAYGLAGMAQLPNAVEVVVIADNDRPPAGASFLAMPTAAPALANAVFRATAVRVRRLPLMKELLRLL
ncbi:xanthine dehydrogenase family protein molybdopterin-binding subunit [Dyella ginsengisoli]|uniref:xanthine dehydrogenase family protein molybdopterin-binding subunit n=1 Tax=Dyella ginsengisoli TaxID=363848 RepID=UPI0003487ECC|nr:molybdopterin cofactor-binding domain-containing protein [Dyella ginsengisoli]